MASTYISRTTGTPTDNQKCTVSFWWKNSEAHPLNSGSDRVIFGTETTAASYIYLRKTAELSVWQASTGTFDFRTTRLVTDPAAWYHICYTIDTTLATAADRVKIYINGVRETVLNASSAPAQDSAVRWNEASKVIYIGGGFNQNMSGLLSHFHFVDGTAYDASTFGETDSTSGIWKIKTGPTVTYGNNGFFMKFEDSSNMDLDSSPNAHTFTTTGDLTSTKDNPSNNFCTMSPLDNSSGFQSDGTQNFTNGNTTVECTATSGNGLTNGNMGMSSGKWYWEMNLQAIGGAYPTIGIGVGSSYNYYVTNAGVGNQTYGYGYLSAGSTNSKGNNGSYAAFGDSFTSGDILSFALDMDNYKFYAAKNGVWQNSGDPTSGATGTGAMYTVNADQTYLPCNSGNSSVKFEYNFGNGYFGTTLITSPEADDAGIGAFKYDVPAGYYALCTKNIKAYGG